MEQLLALLILISGIIMIIVFTPFAWRKAKEEATSVRDSFGQVLENSYLVEEIQTLEAQLAQLKQEYHTISNKAEAVKEAAVPTVEERVVSLPEKEEATFQLYRQVFRAYDEGKSVTEIAKELGRGKGEIELILNLRR